MTIKQSHAEIKNTTIERFLKSFYFSFILFLFWGTFSVLGLKTLLQGFDFVELLWLIYNVTISLLFLIRVKPAVVSTNAWHWIVALVTSFSGFLFSRQDVVDNPVLSSAAHIIILTGILLGIIAAVVLGRSYDFLPALRRVKTQFAYRWVRHPMYLSSMIIKLGYVLKNPSVYNILIFAIIAILYDRRSKYEEDIMSHDTFYADYLRQVKYRFIPGVY